MSLYDTPTSLRDLAVELSAAMSRQFIIAFLTENLFRPCLQCLPANEPTQTPKFRIVPSVPTQQERPTALLQSRVDAMESLVRQGHADAVSGERPDIIRRRSDRWSRWIPVAGLIVELVQTVTSFVRL